MQTMDFAEIEHRTAELAKVLVSVQVMVAAHGRPQLFPLLERHFYSFSHLAGYTHEQLAGLGFDRPEDREIILRAAGVVRDFQVPPRFPPAAPAPLPAASPAAAPAGPVPPADFGAGPAAFSAAPPAPDAAAAAALPPKVASATAAASAGGATTGPAGKSAEPTAAAVSAPQQRQASAAGPAPPAGRGGAVVPDGVERRGVGGPPPLVDLGPGYQTHVHAFIRPRPTALAKRAARAAAAAAAKAAAAGAPSAPTPAPEADAAPAPAVGAGGGQAGVAPPQQELPAVAPVPAAGPVGVSAGPSGRRKSGGATSSAPAAVGAAAVSGEAAATAASSSQDCAPAAAAGCAGQQQKRKAETLGKQGGKQPTAQRVKRAPSKSEQSQQGPGEGGASAGKPGRMYVDPDTRTANEGLQYLCDLADRRAHERQEQERAEKLAAAVAEGPIDVDSSDSD